MNNATYIMCSHVDWTQRPLGKVFFYQVFDATGLQCGQHVGDHETAKQYAANWCLEWISAADLGELWACHWNDNGERERAEEILLRHQAAEIAKEVSDGQ